MAALPLAFGETSVAIIFSLLNLALLAYRVNQEDRALHVRQNL
jgi:isoprenylcysteine carboxyl methyltransferase (ICMT) family protein YpbQ